MKKIAGPSLFALVAAACSGHSPTPTLLAPSTVQQPTSGNIVACSGPPTHGSPPTVYVCDDSFFMKRGEMLVVPSPGVLANDKIPAGRTPRFEPPVGSATLVDTGNGAFRLTLSNDIRGVAFRYSVVVDDNVAPISATVTVTIQ